MVSFKQLCSKKNPMSALLIGLEIYVDLYLYYMDIIVENAIRRLTQYTP